MSKLTVFAIALTLFNMVVAVYLSEFQAAIAWGTALLAWILVTLSERLDTVRRATIAMQDKRISALIYKAYRTTQGEEP